MVAAPPRYAIGTANAVEFFVTLAISVTLWVGLGSFRWDLIVALLIAAVGLFGVLGYAAMILLSSLLRLVLFGAVGGPQYDTLDRPLRPERHGLKKEP